MSGRRCVHAELRWMLQVSEQSVPGGGGEGEECDRWRGGGGGGQWE